MPHETEPEIFAEAEKGLPGRAKKRCALWVWLAAAALIAALYSGFWYFMAGRVADNLTAFMAQAGQNGVAIRCADLRKSGFPLRLDLACSALAVSADAPPAKIAAAANTEQNSAFAFHSGFVSAGAPVYAPHWVALEMGAPAALKLPMFKEIKADWQTLRCEGDFTARHPRNLTFTAEKPIISNLPFKSSGAPLAADFIRFSTKRQADDKALFSLSFDNLSVPYALSGTAGALPAADGAAELTINHADAFYAALPRLLQNGDTALLRGRSGNVHRAQLSFAPGGGFTFSGPFSVAENGRISGRITLAVNDAQALLRTVRSVWPDQADNLKSLFFVLNSMPKNALGEPELTLDIEDGRIHMGFLRLGKIPPL